MTKRPLLLLSNDDGFDSQGMRELVKSLRPVGDLIVVAPSGPRSGSSGAITSQVPLECTPVSVEPGLEIYKCTGTPVDCVKLALHAVVPRIPDVVIGGINHGDNSSVNVHYSGTMGVVLEGCLKGIPSVGFSLCDHSADADFSATLPYVRKIVEDVLTEGLPYGVCLNVNFPAEKTLKGVRVCRQTDGRWTNEFVEREHPHRSNYYWLTGVYVNNEPGSEDTDRWALEHGYVAVTPIRTDMTAYGDMERLSAWNWMPDDLQMTD